MSVNLSLHWPKCFRSLLSKYLSCPLVSPPPRIPPTSSQLIHPNRYGTYKLVQQMPGGEKMTGFTRILHRVSADECMDEVRGTKRVHKAGMMFVMAGCLRLMV